MRGCSKATSVLWFSYIKSFLNKTVSAELWVSIELLAPPRFSLDKQRQNLPSSYLYFLLLSTIAESSLDLRFFLGYIPCLCTVPLKITYFVNPPFTWKSNVLAWLLWPDRGNFCNFQMHCIKKECKYWNMKEERFAKPLSRSRLFSTFAWSRNNPRNFKLLKIWIIMLCHLCHFPVPQRPK